MIAKKAVQINRVECKYFSLNNWLIGNLLLTFSTFAGSFQSPAKPIFFAIKFNRTSAFLGCLEVRKSMDSGNQINNTTKSKPVKIAPARNTERHPYSPCSITANIPPNTAPIPNPAA